jgi:peptidoglycan-N-acetylglucosamine deacetylase
VRHLVSAATWATAFLVGSLGCSASDDRPSERAGGAGAPSVAGSGAGGGAGSPGSGGSAGRAGTAGVGGSVSTGGAAGAAGAAGSSGASGAGGDDDAGAADSGFPVPDKLVALTFDDGPNVTLTAAVLDKLEAHQVPASFFLIGQNISAATQGVLQRAASLGCTFENHSFGFAALTGLTPEQVAESVDQTTAAIEQFTDDSPQFFRAPNLATDANMFATIDLPFAAGIVGGDFPGANPTVDGVTSTVLGQVQDGSIILLHDVQPSLDPQPTPPALDIIIPTLRSQGYEFVTLRELFQRRGIDPNSQQDVPWSVVPPS